MKKVIFACLLIFFSISSIADESFVIYQGLAEAQTLSVSVSEAKSQGENKYFVWISGKAQDVTPKIVLTEKIFPNPDSSNVYYFQELGTKKIVLKRNGNKSLLLGSLIEYLELLSNKSVHKIYFFQLGKEKDFKRAEEAYIAEQGFQESLVKTKSSLQASLDEMNKICNSNIKLVVDWDAFTKKNEKTLPSVGVNYIQSMVNICKEDKDYQEAIKATAKIHFQRSDITKEHFVSLKDKTLNLKIGKEVPNIKFTSYELIKSAL